MPLLFSSGCSTPIPQISVSHTGLFFHQLGQHLRPAVAVAIRRNAIHPAALLHYAFAQDNVCVQGLFTGGDHRISFCARR